jgi:hypothetical protein
VQAVDDRTAIFARGGDFTVTMSFSMPSAPPSARTQPVAVYGGGGHIGHFVVDELQRRGMPVITVGRGAATLPAGVPTRVASIDDTEALARAFAECSVVINCAGPFLDTAESVIEAAIKANAGYLDVTAEQGQRHQDLRALRRFRVRGRCRSDTGRWLLWRPGHCLAGEDPEPDLH